METDLYLKIDHLKNKFDKVHAFYHKYAIEALVFVLEDYLGIPDIGFKKHVENKSIYTKLKRIKNVRYHKSFKDLINNNYKLVSNFIIPYAIEDSKRVESHRESYIEFNDCLRIVSEFLKSVSPDLYNMFCNMYRSNRILFSGQHSGGCELCEKKKNSIYVIIGNLNSVDDMANLIHELGHAYKDYRYQKCHKYYNVNEVLESEISSEVLELMFLDFLLKNNIYYNDAVYSFKYYHERIIDDAKRLSRLDHDVYSKSFISNLSYFIGRVVACNYMINKDMTYDELINYAYKRNIIRLLQELNIDHDKVLEKIREFQR